MVWFPLQLQFPTKLVYDDIAMMWYGFAIPQVLAPSVSNKPGESILNLSDYVLLLTRQGQAGSVFAQPDLIQLRTSHSSDTS